MNDTVVNLTCSLIIGLTYKYVYAVVAFLYSLVRR